MNDPNLNAMLRWGILNSDFTRKDPNAPQADPSKGLDQDMMMALFNPTSAVPSPEPSTPDPASPPKSMTEAMATIKSPSVSFDEKKTAFERFNDLVEDSYHANNMEPLGLWPKLVGELESSDATMRAYAALGIHKAAQNNRPAQEKVFALGLIPKLVDMGISDPETDVRRVAISALSSSVRNFQPALDAAWMTLPDKHKPGQKPSTSDMSQVNEVIDSLRADLPKKQNPKQEPSVESQESQANHVDDVINSPAASPAADLLEINKHVLAGVSS